MSAPERIYIDRGPRGGWMHRHERMPDTQHEFVRTDLIPAMIREAVEAEREACALVAEHQHKEWAALGNACLVDDDMSACSDIAAAIRARKGGEA